MSRQLALNLKLRDGSSFDNFFTTSNREALASVVTAATAAVQPASKLTTVFLWGESGSGKTHLLEAACRAAQAAGLSPLYVSLAQARALPVDLLEDVEQAVLVALDDVQCIAGDPVWEAAVLRLYEGLRAHGGVLLAGASASPTHLGLHLPDLATRLADKPSAAWATHMRFAASAFSPPLCSPASVHCRARFTTAPLW